MFSLIFDFLLKIVDIVNKNEEINKQEKQTISDVLNQISEIILDTAVKFSKDEYPHGNCVIMENLSNQLHFKLIDYMEQDELDKLHALLIEASKLEKLFALRSNKDIIKELMHISGEFKTMSMLIKL